MTLRIFSILFCLHAWANDQRPDDTKKTCDRAFDEPTEPLRPISSDQLTGRYDRQSVRNTGIDRGSSGSDSRPDFSP